MGRIKDMLIEMQNYAYEINIAKILGISLDDLMRLDWNIETDESSNGVV